MKKALLVKDVSCGVVRIGLGDFNHHVHGIASRVGGFKWKFCFRSQILRLVSLMKTTRDWFEMSMSAHHSPPFLFLFPQK